MADPQVDWRKVAQLVILSRELDSLEENQLTPQGKIKYQFSAMGHELAQVLLAQALDHPNDAASVYYRSRPFLLACGFTPEEALASGMARLGYPSDGRDAGVVFNLPRRNGPTVLPMSGDVGSQYTPAVGWAQASIYHRKVLKNTEWDQSIAVALGGDGSVAENGFWSALNIATTLRLPVMFFIEDNQFGISVPSSLQTPGGNIAANLASYGNLCVLDGDGTQPAEAWELISTAVKHTRSGEGPALLRLHVPRLHGHTFIDDQAYKSPEQRSAEADRDPVPRLKEFLINQGFTLDDWDHLVAETKITLSEAVKAAESKPAPDPDKIKEHLYYNGVAPLMGGLRPEGVLIPLGTAEIVSTGPRINLIEAIRRTLESEMHANTRMLVFGEDVGVKGGVHGTTLDMQAHFGVERVFDTSLSEEGIIGRSIGMAMAGLLPVPEIQFRKYADPAHEQITDIGTIRWRTAGRCAAPLVVRIPVGYGKKAGDPWHSVSGEAIFAHLLGWRIAFPSNTVDAVGLLRTALRGDDPTFFLEHRALLDTAESRRPYPGDNYCLPFGKSNMITAGDELTVVTWGEMVYRCLAAAEKFPARVSIIDLRTLLPWDKETVLESVRHTGKVLLVHEDTLTAGFAGEIIATIADQAFTFLDAPIRRLATPDVPIPYNAGLMDAVLPSVMCIQEEMTNLLEW